ncbi:MAG: MotA/TolQ/ExbB proton channel family protein [Candidatus Omnitrophica bacterium]|nr:MotA/TolQ/ExbB proton channel family protein [Candidatus Omnitrophota bacterium]
MGFTTIIGLILGFTIILGVILFQGGLERLLSFFDPSALFITLGCSISAIIINYGFKGLFLGLKATKYAFIGRLPSAEELIDTLVKIAIKARREGFLSLREENTQGKFPLLDLGLSLVSDGTDPEIVRDILETKATAEAEALAFNERLWRDLAVYAPMFGMLGTVIGLILMLRSLTDPAAIGPAMALALITTLYGLVIAGLICLPLAGKIHLYNENYSLLRDLIIEGILSIQAGYSSQIVEERLKAHLKK